MKAIKLLTLILCSLLVLTCSNDDDSKRYNNNEGQFIRFFLLVNSNDEPLEFPEVDGKAIALSSLDKTDIKTLKIPVAITSLNLSENTKATFETTITGGIDLTVTPQETLVFGPEKLVDTIFVTVNSKWDSSLMPQLKLYLTNVSNSDITIGIPNSLEPNNELTVNFTELELPFSFNTNRIEIAGEIGEEVEFKVLFPSNYFLDDIDDTEIFTFLNGFDYSLSRTGQDATSISYKIILNENIQNNDAYYESVISLIDSDIYKVSGTTTLQIVKPIAISRDKTVNTASNFYNLADSFYRTYGETWNDFNGDGICQWSSFNAFTYPVVVSADSPNAVLYDDKGTTDTADDIYHDAFKIGFKTPNTITTTTNSFNLKRWFSNESSSGLNSPGFDINPALEFFPENGNSMTRGTVLVIPQYITIAGTNGNTYSIAISGDGTYEEISAGLFEISLEFKATNQALFGGSVLVEYKIYNKNTYTDPADLSNSNCITEYDL